MDQHSTVTIVVRDAFDVVVSNETFSAPRTRPYAPLIGSSRFLSWLGLGPRTPRTEVPAR